MTLSNKIERLITQNLSALVQISNKAIIFHFLGLGSFSENIYKVNISLKTA